MKKSIIIATMAGVMAMGFGVGEVSASIRSKITGVDAKLAKKEKKIAAMQVQGVVASTEEGAIVNRCLRYSVEATQLFLVILKTSKSVDKELIGLATNLKTFFDNAFDPAKQKKCLDAARIIISRMNAKGIMADSQYESKGFLIRVFFERFCKIWEKYAANNTNDEATNNSQDKIFVGTFLKVIDALRVVSAELNAYTGDGVTTPAGNQSMYAEGSDYSMNSTVNRSRAASAYDKYSDSTAAFVDKRLASTQFNPNNKNMSNVPGAFQKSPTQTYGRPGQSVVNQQFSSQQPQKMQRSTSMNLVQLQNFADDDSGS